MAYENFREMIASAMRDIGRIHEHKWRAVWRVQFVRCCLGGLVVDFALS